MNFKNLLPTPPRFILALVMALVLAAPASADKAAVAAFKDCAQGTNHAEWKTCKFMLDQDLRKAKGQKGAYVARHKRNNEFSIEVTGTNISRPPAEAGYVRWQQGIQGRWHSGEQGTHLFLQGGALDRTFKEDGPDTFLPNRPESGPGPE